MKYRDKSVRDLPQEAKLLNKDEVEIRSFVGRQLANKFTIQVKYWPSHIIDQVNFLRKTNNLDDEPGGDCQAQRIYESQAKAVDWILKDCNLKG